MPGGGEQVPAGIDPHIPLGLYVHLPWCVAKCPYCDFNSHELRGELKSDAYTAALLADFARERTLIGDRAVETVFFGGGTPSLFPADTVAKVLAAAAVEGGGAEVTLEANPGASERGSFAAFRAAGVNRISLGVQSFDDGQLRALGRIHDAGEAQRAIRQVRDAGFANFNIDLMFGLPGQTVNGALDDLRAALAFEPPHLSHYQLTLEPGTPFKRNPPVLPDDDRLWEMQVRCQELLAQEGYEQYEVSAYARPGQRCRHNLNYWRYGDYAGIGAGAHGKLTVDGAVRRAERVRHPSRYLSACEAGEQVSAERLPDERERCFEFALNALRLREGFSSGLFEGRALQAGDALKGPVATAMERGLLEQHQPGCWRPTDLGWRFLNDLQALFL
ncbi:MAG: radical SAM family heme chaperone HemW [Pseudomonadota bacterium]